MRHEYYGEASAGSLPVGTKTPSTLMFRAMAHPALPERRRRQNSPRISPPRFPSFTVENFILHYGVSSRPAREAIRVGAKLANLGQI